MSSLSPLNFRRGALALSVASAALCLGSAAWAQDLQTPEQPLAPADTPMPQGDDQVSFAADTLNYDSETEIITASGNVQLLRQGNRLRADEVVWNRNTGEVKAIGNVSLTTPQGDTAYGDDVKVTEELKAGIVQNMLVVLAKGGRLAANQGNRDDAGVITLNQAAYTACAVEDSEGCPKEPSWKIQARKVVYDPNRQRVRYEGARISLFGLPLFPLPGLSHPTGDTGGTGLLVPDIRYDRVNGAEVALPYFFKLAPNSDATVTPHIYSNTAPMLEGTYRALVNQGAFQVTGYATYGSRIPASSTTTQSQEDLRGAIDATGSFQLDPYWSINAAIRAASDKTFLRRYDISRDDQLRSTFNLERIGEQSYFSLSGWAIQTLRADVDQGTQPLALPVIDYRRRLADPLLGGRIQLQLNSLAIARTEGQDTQRAFASFQWDLRKITPWGQEVTFTTYLRGDIYHSSGNDQTSTLIYQGLSGWQTRGIAAAAVDMRWPLIGPAFGGTQRIVPRIQIVAAPRLANLRVPNEDARSVDLEDSNLFALNRFPGYDRFEDSTRITYGFEYALDRPGLSVDAIVGQSYRLDDRPSLLPDGTGLSEQLSDIVGRTTVRFRDFVAFTHRYRIDKDNLTVRRNEIDATVGTKRTYVTMGYLRLNRDVDTSVEDLRDREEIRLAGRIQLARYWSVFGSTVVDLTGKDEDPLSIADGYDPIRHRLGISYQDDCLELGLTWRRDYQTTGDARSGNTFLLRIALRNLGI